MFALLGALFVGQAHGGCIERDELQCEEAVARIQQCCPGVVRRVNCESFETSCGPVNADIGVAAAHCIREASCAELVARSVCAWASSTASPSSGEQLPMSPLPLLLAAALAAGMALGRYDDIPIRAASASLGVRR